jgi:signal transduction histidine kinase
MQGIKRLLKNFRALRISLSLKFIIGTCVVLIITLGTSIYFISKKHEAMVYRQLGIQAKVLFKQIVLTRRWVADHGGVFVEKVPWKNPSPYLSEPEIIDLKGRKYIKESPAMVTKELSNYAKEKGLFWFHITSLKLINPENAPDDFEKMALSEFETQNIKEVSKVEKIDESYYYRYIAPLYVEKPCLKCHSHQGYRIGDVRGAISVSIPMDFAISMINSERKWLITASIVTITVLIMVLYLMMKELVLRPVRQLKSSINDFAVGNKTETHRVRTGDELEDLCDSFADMSKSLTEYHTDLEGKIRTATKNLEDVNARLSELNEKKSDFIAKISHELRTPMTSIKGAMDYISSKISMISSNNKDSEDLTEFLDVIKNNADRLVRLVNATLDLERIESGGFVLHFSQVDLLTLIKEVIISFESITSEKNITFELKGSPKILITVDEDRIRQVLINIILNALQISPDNSEIHIATIESGNEVTVFIHDEGPGIPATIHEKIFDKFYTIGKRHGTGLGLAICKGIIEAHGGKIGVLSKEEEKGTTFYFNLPRKKNDS